MNAKQSTDITLNGVVFTPGMIKTLQEWYNRQIKGEDGASVMIHCLQNAQKCLIDLSNENYEKDSEIMSALRQLMFVQEQLKPFVPTEGGAV